MLPPHQRLRVIVAGLVGTHPLGGVAWDYLHYVLGLHELGHDVYYHEDTWVWPFDPVHRYPTDDATYSATFLRDFFDRHAPALADKWHYVLLHETSFGMSREAFRDVARTADVFLNVSGASMLPDQLGPRCVKVFVDTDPGWNQVRLATRPAWSPHVDRWAASVAAHDRHLTYAENIYGDDCTIPRLHFDWRPTRCVATLHPWAELRKTPPPADAPFTTVMSWDYFPGRLKWDGREYRQKPTAFCQYRALPRRSPVPLELAVGGWRCPRDMLRANGWRQMDGFDVSRTPQSYVNYVRESAGEWSVAKHVYASTNSGWFSSRTACYLAAGRPVVVQETGWSKYLPAGRGLHAFASVDEALDALGKCAADPRGEQAAACDIAREYTAPDRVLPPMIEAIFAPPGRRGSKQALPPRRCVPNNGGDI